MKRTIFLSCISLVIIITSGAFQRLPAQTGYYDHNKNGSMDPYENPQLALRQRVEDLLKRFTIQQKITLLCGWVAGAPGTTLPVTQRPVCTQFPQYIALGATWDPDLAQDVNRAHFREECIIRGNGFEPNGTSIWYFIGGGAGNVARDPRWGRTDHLSSGEDPYLNFRVGGAHMPAMYNNEGKRFNTSFPLPNTRLLRDYYLAAYRYAAESGNPAEVFMVAYNGINGVPNHANKFLLHDILRKEYGFYGVMIDDYGGPRWVYENYRYVSSLRLAAIASLRAGIDQDGSSPANIQIFDDELIPALNAGQITSAEIDTPVTRILGIEMRQGKYDPPEAVMRYRVPFTTVEFVSNRLIPAAMLHGPEHTALALRAARESMTLLKNKNNVLPLDKSSIKRIALFGNPARKQFGGNRGAYSRPAVSSDVSPEQGIRNKLANTGTTVTVSTNPADARGCDAAVYVTDMQDQEGEFVDRMNLNLPVDQENQIKALAATGTPVIVVLVAGSCVTMQNWVDSVDAIAVAWYPGQEGGTAIADVLFGDYNPAGRLPLTFYKSVSQLPSYDEYDIGSAGTTYLYLKTEPQFPFGYGLSYTTFSYGNLRVDPAQSSGENIRVRFEVRNTGTRDGDEVAQVYVHDIVRSTNDQPVKQLVQFARVNLKQGETKTLDLTIDIKHLSFHDRDTNRIIEPGFFELMVGASSRDIALRDTFEVTKLISLGRGIVVNTLKGDPGPATGFSSPLPAGGPVKIEFIDMRGKKVAECSMQDAHKNIDAKVLGRAAHGVYIVRVYRGHVGYYTKKFVFMK